MLKSKQIRYLRSLANPLNAYFQVGKDGVNDNLIAIIQDGLEAHELVKISILKSCSDNVDDVATQLVQGTRSQLVQIIGHTVILYRKSHQPKIQIPL